MTAIVALLGGVRATVFLAASLILLAIVGVMSHQLANRDADIVILQTSVDDAAKVNKGNLDAVAALQQANADFAAQCQIDKDKLAATLKQASEREANITEQNETLKSKMAEVYRANPAADAWRRNVVPDAVIDGLRNGQ